MCDADDCCCPQQNSTVTITEDKNGTNSSKKVVVGDIKWGPGDDCIFDNYEQLSFPFAVF